MHKFIFYALFLYCSISFSQNQDDWTSVLNSGMQKIDFQDYLGAVTDLETARQYASKLFGKNSIEYGQSTFYMTLASLQFNPESALTYALETKDIFKKQLGEDSHDYMTILIILGGIYMDLKQFDKAKKTYMDSLELARTVYGDTSAYYGMAYTNIASVFREASDYNSALEYFNKGMAILKDNPEFPEVYYNNIRYNSLSVIYEGLGEYDKALELHQESLNYIGDTYGKYTVNYAHILQSVGSVQLSLGLLKQAEKSLLESVRILQTAEDNQFDESLANAYMGLVLYYTATYDYQSALEYSTLALELNGLFEGAALLRDISYYDILSNLYFSIGMDNVGISMSEKAVLRSKEIYGENSLEYARHLSDYGNALILFDHELSKESLYKALDIAKKIDINSPQYQDCMMNIIPVLVEEENYTEAIEIAKEQVSKSLNPSNSYWNAMVTLGDLYLLDKNYDKAESTFQKALKDVKGTYGKNHPKYAEVLERLIETQFYKKNYSALPELIKECNPLVIEQVKDFFRFTSEKPKQMYLSTLKNTFNLFEVIGLSVPENDEISAINYENKLLLKGILLNTSKDIISKLSDLNDFEIDDLITEYLMKKNQNDKDRISQKDNISDQSSNLISLESSLTEIYNKEFKTDYRHQFIKSFKDVQKALNDEEIAIEFSRIDNSILYNEETNYIYVAYVLTKRMKYPKVVVLGNEKNLKTLMKKSDNPNQLYSSRGSSSQNTGSNTLNKDIYDFIWKPLENSLQDVTTIYFSLDGMLHKMPVTVLSGEDNKMLIDKYRLIQLNNTYSITEANKNPEVSNSLFIGGVTYDYSDSEVSSTELPVALMNYSKMRSNNTAGNWNYLPGTLEEVNDIAHLYDVKSIEYSILSDSNATEKKFKELSGKSPSVMHIATHGFFFENIDDKLNSNSNVFKVSNDPLLRAGLLLSGANYTWQHGLNPNQDEDGVLTALEISNLDFSNTDLVVLSACETGLGQIEDNEGVYGLQRAFKKAGVQKIIMSLWQVPDKETAEFMQLFYSKWLDGNSLRESFGFAQHEMSLLYPNSPVKWAAFVLIE